MAENGEIIISKNLITTIIEITATGPATAKKHRKVNQVKNGNTRRKTKKSLYYRNPHISFQQNSVTLSSDNST